ncbi:flavin-containing monooxygenase [Streptomyces sp. NPDC060209]|uniref:flavin-containing monooxygenase n=1 Tax=Streptomyces sp. NPDC060209 TaxID=3347073 RepID=UPI00364F4722
MKVCVIGSGICGIAAVRELQRHLPAGSLHWLSEDREAGGLWNSSSPRSRVYDALYLNTSRELSSFTGSPIRAEATVQYLHHSRYAAYLEEVAAECEGAERHWECRVTSVERQPDGAWKVRWVEPDGSDAEAAFDAVVDATGHNGEPRGPQVPVAADPTYAYAHSSDYRNPEPYRGKHVLVVGNGASAVDIACDLVTAAAGVGISIRTPKWHLPKMILGKPVDHSSDGLLRRVPLVGGLTAKAAESVVRRLTGSYAGYGLPRPGKPLATSTPVLSDHFLPHLSHGRLRVYSRVEALEQESVRFADGTSEKFDAVIAATGFSESSPHLPAEARRVLREGRLGLALEAPGCRGLFLMNRFRCGEAAVRCAEPQAAAVARALSRPRYGTDTPPGAPAPSGAGSRVTARILEKVYEAYR